MSSKTKKNNKSKKIRKITFLQGKEGETLTSFKQSDGQEINSFFSGLISNHPECAFNNQRFKKPEKVTTTEEADNDKVEEAKSKNPIKDELIFGITEVMRKIQRNLVIGVVISDPLTIHLQATLRDLCQEFGVAYLISKNLDNLSNILGISKLACFGLTEKVKDPLSLCHPLFQTFKQLTQNPSQEIIQKSSTLTKQQTKSDAIKKSSGDEFVFDMPPEENFFIEVEEANTPSEIEKFSDENTPKLKMADFINVEETTNYFPSRSFFKHIDLTIPWVDVKAETRKISNLGQH
uniref:Ribosomal protein L7Ae/L30e/S12e/Gadd45 domain-containing protein n=1 Tax=Tetranychus urticae TaxID=32264 RepID=T1KIF7_TETUR